MKIEIRRAGSYFEIDEQGYLVNPTEQAVIQKEYEHLINKVIVVYKEKFGENLRNVYVRGSVAKGQAVHGVSDLDTMAYIDLPQTEIERIEFSEDKTNLLKEHVFVTDIEFEPLTLDMAAEDGLMLIQSKCVYGTPFDPPKVKVSKEIALNYLGFFKAMEWFDNRMEVSIPEPQLEEACRWLCKRILRSGFDLCIEKSSRYTRDLYLCWETFSEFYPSESERMKEVLFLALNPVPDRSKIMTVKKYWEEWFGSHNLHRG